MKVKIIKKKIYNLRNIKSSSVKKEFLTITKKIPDIVHLKNIVFFSFLFSIIIFILFLGRFSTLHSYYSFSKPVYGGIYTEGVVGEIKRINPLFSITNPAEDDLNSLIFSGLTKIDKEGKVTADLAESWSVSPDGKSYNFKLRDDIKWHDGTKITTDDVIFTISTIQNPDTRSNLFASWKGVQTEKINDREFKIILEKSLNSFINSTTIGLLPMHILEKVPASNLKITEFNMQPVGSGPFVFEKIENNKDFTVVFLNANKNYYKKKPYIEKIKIRTYRNENALIDGYLKKEIFGISSISPDNYEKTMKLKGLNLFSHNLHEYSAVFFNQKVEILKDKNVRKALSGVIDKENLAGNFNEALVVSGTVSSKKQKRENIMSVKEAGDLLEKSGWKLENGIRKKEGKELKIDMVSGDNGEFKKISEKIAGKWREIGVNVDEKYYNLVDLQQNYIRPRNYGILIFKVNTGPFGDLYPYLGSSGKNDPGLNFSYFDDSKVNKYLEIARETFDLEKRNDMTTKAQDIITEEKPLLFLYSLPYVYGVSSNIKGVDIDKINEPKERFWNVEEWYLKE